MTDKKQEKEKKSGILFSAVINVSGEPDVGKTTFGLECGASPDRFIFIDDDVKGQAIAAEMEALGKPFAKYINLVDATRGMKETQFHEYCINMINGIEAGRYDALLWDTFTRFERSFHPWVLTHQQDFKERWSSSGVIHGSEIWQMAQKYESEIIDLLQTKVPLVILTSHMKEENLNGIRTGKSIPDAMKPVRQKSTFRVMLRRSEDGSPIPTGLILKRIARRIVTENGIETVNVMPQKVPHFSWAKIREYWETPVGNRPPLPEEMPNAFEISMLDSSVLTDDQRLVMRTALKASMSGNDNEDDDPSAAMRADMQSMRASGKSIPEIASTYGIEIKDVLEVLK